MVNIIILFILALALSLNGATYTVDKVTPGSAHLSFRLHDYEIDQPKPLTLYFAVTVINNVALEGYASTDDNTFSSPLTVESRGNYGDSYIQWFSFSLGSPNSAVPAEGKITIKAEQPIFGSLQKPVTDTNSIIRLPLRPVLKKSLSSKSEPPPFNIGLRMSIDQDGIYFLPYEKLQKAGVPLSRISPHTVKLFNNGKEIPIHVSSRSGVDFRPGDFISFYGRALRGEHHHHLSQFAHCDVYWLVWELSGVGLRAAEVSGARKRNEIISVDPSGEQSRINANEFPDTIHFEKDSDIRWLGSIYNVEQMADAFTSENSIDNWYWGLIGDKELTDFTIDVSSPSRNKNQSARLRIAFIGLSSNSGIENDHMLEILLNDDQFGESPQIASWDGQKSYIFESDFFPVNRLREGTNKITFRRPDRPFVDRTALNWIELEYVRNFKTHDNSLSFRSNPKDTNGLFHFTLSGFKSPGIDLWDITHNRVFSRMEISHNAAAGEYEVSFQDSIMRPTRYMAVCHSKRLTPKKMILDTIRREWDFFNINYLMITTDSLLSTLKPLADLHEKRGLKTRIVAVEDIYNRFSHGIQNPSSIRMLIDHIISSQNTHTLKYVLLAGDASHDLYKQREDLTLVPTHLSGVPGWGPAACDDYFVTVKGSDNFPDAAVGRLPARNREDLRIMVEKTVNYIVHPQRGYWRDNLLLAGGREEDFTLFNDKVQSNILSQRFNVIRMDADPKSPFYHSQSTAASQMTGHINSGVSILNFAGHGGGNIWSDSRFFSYEDLPNLHNSQWGKGGRLPVIFSFTCLTGFFESVFYKSLGEEFLRNGPDGSIAFYGASAYTLKEIDLKFNSILLENLVHGSFNTLGELIRHSELVALVKYRSQALPVVNQYNLLGDPALPLDFPAESLNITLRNSYLTGKDTLKVVGSTQPIDSGSVRISLEAEGKKWHEVLLPVKNARFDYSFPVKTSVKASKGLIRACAWNDSAEIVGWHPFTKDTMGVHDITLSPTYPGINDSIYVKCHITAPDSLSNPQVVCVYTLGESNQRNLDFEKFPPIRMLKDTGGFWLNEQPIVFSDLSEDLYSNTNLFVKFYISSASGETAVIPFQLKNLPDLVFTQNTSTKCFWHDDSLRATFEMLNRGNAPAPPFKLSLFVKNASGHLSKTFSVKDTVAPGETVTHTFSIPDANGDLSFFAQVNPDRTFEEIKHSNNSHNFVDTISFTDIRLPADTLYSSGKGYAVTAHDTLSRSYRVFMFSYPLSNAPLSTSSKWMSVGNGGIRGFRLNTRPGLRAEDSLRIKVTAAENQISTDSESKSITGTPALFLHDTLSKVWSNKVSLMRKDKHFVSEPTNLTGPFGFGFSSDSIPPQIQALIGGKEMHTVDYTPSNKPFTFIITDQSGIDPGSVILLLNNDTLEKKSWSADLQTQDPTSITLTALPPALQAIDSMTVIAADLAGNRTEETFSYLPGGKLSIRFFSCHPNPFAAKRGKKIRFAFLLTDVAEEVTISIFTIASRRIASLDFAPNLIGYQEYAWDGLTDDGYRIANGTYYAKLTAKNEDNTVSKIIRIVKLEGF